MTARQARECVRRAARPITDNPKDFTPLLDLIGDARFVLIGEESHGTQEFYRDRAELTKLLIREKEFCAVAAEADWPDAHGITSYVSGKSNGGAAGAERSLSRFTRFPLWMWRNTEVLKFVRWLHDHNAASDEEPVGFYGLDLYSLFGSVKAVLDFLESTNPEEARRARERYDCLGLLSSDDGQAYGYRLTAGQNGDCEDEVLEQLVALREQQAAFLSADGRRARDDFFYAHQNARLVHSAEQYYRAMFSGKENTWNLRDRHMAETLEELANHLSQHQPNPKIVVWAHNSHIGDARFTDMGMRRGQLNLGQLARERYRRGAILIGFSTYSGTVTAASRWGGVMERKTVRPALEESYEALFHEARSGESFLLPLHANREIFEALLPERLERAIGVIYRPETERFSHYFDASLSRQFDAVIHRDVTSAVEPLDHSLRWNKERVPETYPHGL
ncbi:MAG: erythromycin esterase family protein [Sumerlaeia bacterium]